MREGPLVAVPHWRAPTWERTKFYYDALEAGGARYLVVEGDELPDNVRGLLLTGGVTSIRGSTEKRGVRSRIGLIVNVTTRSSDCFSQL